LALTPAHVDLRRSPGPSPRRPPCRSSSSSSPGRTRHWRRIPPPAYDWTPSKDVPLVARLRAISHGPPHRCPVRTAPRPPATPRDSRGRRPGLDRPVRLPLPCPRARRGAVRGALIGTPGHSSAGRPATAQKALRSSGSAVARTPVAIQARAMSPPGACPCVTGAACAGSVCSSAPRCSRLRAALAACCAALAAFEHFGQRRGLGPFVVRRWNSAPHSHLQARGSLRGSARAGLRLDEGAYAFLAVNARGHIDNHPRLKLHRSSRLSLGAICRYFFTPPDASVGPCVSWMARRWRNGCRSDL
jgi:hypothetical protein